MRRHLPLLLILALAVSSVFVFPTFDSQEASASHGIGGSRLVVGVDFNTSGNSATTVNGIGPTLTDAQIAAGIQNIGTTTGVGTLTFDLVVTNFVGPASGSDGVGSYIYCLEAEPSTTAIDLTSASVTLVKEPASLVATAPADCNGDGTPAGVQFGASNSISGNTGSGTLATITAPQTGTGQAIIKVFSVFAIGTDSGNLVMPDPAPAGITDPNSTTAEIDATLNPVAFDAASSATTGGSNTCTIAGFTVGSGANRLLLVGVSIRNNLNQKVSTLPAPTYAGVPLTFVGAKANGSNARTEMWRLINPATGTNDIVVTLTAAAEAVCGATSWTGVNQTTPLGRLVGATGTSTTPSVNAASAAGEVVHDTLAAKSDGFVDVNATADPTQTERWNASTGTVVRGAGSSEPGAGTVTMSWLLDSAQPWSILAVPIKPVLAPPTFDAASTCTSGSAPSYTWSHTVANGPNRLLLVGVSIRNGLNQNVSRVTYAGQTLTSVGAIANGSNVRTEMWRLINPPAGTNNVAVTLSAAAEAVASATSWTGVNQATPLGAKASATGTSTTPSKAVSIAPGQVAYDVLAAKSDATATVGEGQTEHWNKAACLAVRGAGSSESGVGTVTMSWNLDSVQPWAILVVPINRAP